MTSGLVCALALIAAGAATGVLWAATAPRIDVAAVTRGSESVYDSQAGVDAYFGMIAAVSGIIGGVVAFWRGRDEGWPVPVGLAAGGWLGSMLGGWIGHGLRSHRVLSQLPPGAGNLVTSLVDFRVRSTGLYLVTPCVALFVLATLVWLSTLRRPPGRARSVGRDVAPTPGPPYVPDAAGSLGEDTATGAGTGAAAGADTDTDTGDGAFSSGSEGP